MPLETRACVIEEEIELIENQIDDIATDVAQLDPTSKRAERLEARGNRLDAHRRGLEWARREYGGDAVIELGGLTAGEYGRMEDDLPDDAGDGATRTTYVAHGTVDAPYAADDIDTTIANVATLPIGLVRWAEGQINGLTSVGDTGNRFYSSLAAKRAEETSTDESG